MNTVEIMYPYCYRISSGLTCAEIRKQLRQAIGRFGFLTGSRRFGLESQQSDYDYVVPLKEVEHLLYLPNLKYYNKHPERPSLSLKLYTLLVEETQLSLISAPVDPDWPLTWGTVESLYALECEFVMERYVPYIKTACCVNIILADTRDDFFAWKNATDAFVRLVNKSPSHKALARDKAFRVKVFEGLREYYGIGDKK